MTGRNLTDFIDSWLASWTGNQPEKLIGYYSTDAYYQDPARPTGLRGDAAILGYFRKLLAVNPAWRWRRVEVIPTEKGCCLKWEATIPTEGDDIHFTGLDIVEMEGDKITRNEVYFDASVLK
jgi:hypothetical protein